MWIRSRLSILFFVFFIVYVLIVFLLLKLMMGHLDQKTWFYSQSQSQWLLNQYAMSMDPSREGQIKTGEYARVILYFAGSGLNLEHETRETLKSLAGRGLNGGDAELRRDVEIYLQEQADIIIKNQKRVAGEEVFWSLILVCVIASVAVIMLISLFSINQGILRPIMKLVDRVQDIGKGDFDTPIPVLRNDELGLLAVEFETMRQDLKNALVNHERAIIKLKEREEMAALGRMCTTVAHSIRNPLAAIRSSAEMALRELNSEDVVDIIKEIDLLNHRLNILLNFSNPAGLQSGSTQIITPICAVVRTLKKAFSSKGIQFCVEVPYELEVTMESALLELLLITFIENACEASRKGGTVFVRGNRKDGVTVLEIEDQGVGMESEQVSRIFSPLVSGKHDGSGVGLYLTKKIIEANHGKIKVESAINKGTRIWIELPIRAVYE